jgi:hypothetical protein
MKLTYRGVSYEYNPPTLELTEGEIGGKYRGANWRQSYLRHIPIPQPVANLKYRGVAYSTGHPVDVEASQLRKRYVNGETVTTAEAVPTVSSRKQLLDELNNAHLTNIRRNLEHRLQVARAKGDQNLIRLLEAEAEHMV